MTIQYIPLGAPPPDSVGFKPRRAARIVETAGGGINFDAPYDFKLTPFVTREFKAGVHWRARKWDAANLRWEFTASGRDVAERIIKHFYENLREIPPPPAHCPEARVYRVDGETRFIWQCGEMNDKQYAEFDKITNIGNRRYNADERAWSLPLMFFDRFKRWLAADPLFKLHGYVVAGPAPVEGAHTRDSVIDAAYVEIYGYCPDAGDDREHIARVIVALHSVEDRFLADAFLYFMSSMYADTVRAAAQTIKELGL